MTVYAGETLEIRVSTLDYDAETPLTDSELEYVKISIYDSDETVVVDAEEMTYDDDIEVWVYHWNTQNEDPGSFKVKIEAFGQEASIQHYSMEFSRLRLNRRKVGS